MTSAAELPWLLPAFAAVLGLVWGSFANVVIHRLPLGESIVSPRSRCPGCKNLVASYDNIPVLSFIVLRGRCRRCEARISLRYPAIELALGAASLLSFLRHGPSLEYVVEFAFVIAMVALIFIDFDYQILPDTITLSGLAFGLVLAWPREAITLVDALEGVALGGGLLFAVSELYFRIKKVEGMGFGDVKMMAMVGAFLGWKGVLLTLFLGSFTGSIVGLAVIGLSGGDMKTMLPFGTFLGTGAIATVYAGPPVIAWYSALF